MKLKKYIVCSFLICSSLYTMAQSDHRSDSIDIIQTDISMDATNFQVFKFSTNIFFNVKLGPVNMFRPDLLKMTIDSIYDGISGQALNYVYNDTLLQISLGKNMQTGDSGNIVIVYHGSPVQDASGWGGGYLVGSYAFILGVGFDANPHSYGRTWFPCFDNFVERSGFGIHIKVKKPNSAVANGLLQAIDSLGQGEYIYHWKLDEPIPSYLTCYALAPYTLWNSNYYSQLQGKNIPVMIAALPADTANVRASFSNLNNCLRGFENSYGPYRFERVGYSLVPFNSGAMEHATNIAIPIYAIDGSKTYETLWAHELSHHWWGDNITCRTPADMWLNEGWASYSEALFMENVYGKNAYKKYIADNHLYVLHYAHIADSGYRAVSGVPHQYTYGRTVYKKGADIVHTLRGYFPSDSVFFAACHDFQNTYHFADVSSDDMKNVFQKYTYWKLDLAFDNWIYEPGFPHLEIVYFTYDKQTSELTYKIKQRWLGRSNPYDSLKFELTVFGDNFKFEKIIGLLPGAEYTFKTHIYNFEPIYASIDFDERISDAISDDNAYITLPETLDFTHGMMKVFVKTTGTDSSLIKVEHHWVGPEGNVKPLGAYMSPNRYWTVDGIWHTGFSADAQISYNGVKSTNGGFLDDKLIRITEDSLVLLYREKTSDDWDIYPDYTKLMGAVKTDKKGNITIKNIKKGQYALAMYDKKLGTENIQLPQSTSGFSVFPNPSSGHFTVKLDHEALSDINILVNDMEGHILKNIYLRKGQQSIDITIGQKGVYVVSIPGTELDGKKIVISY